MTDFNAIMQTLYLDFTGLLLKGGRKEKGKGMEGKGMGGRKGEEEGEEREGDVRFFP